MPANYKYAAKTAADLLNALHSVAKFNDYLDEGIDGSLTITSRAVDGTSIQIFRINPQGLLADYQVCAVNREGAVIMAWSGRNTSILAAIKEAGVRTAKQL